MIYRDLKPANVILRPDGTVALIDFGAAREYKVQSLKDTVSLGTRGYAAPEQYEETGQSDARTDIYCLGVMLFQLLTGESPYQAAAAQGMQAFPFCGAGSHSHKVYPDQERGEVSVLPGASVCAGTLSGTGCVFSEPAEEKAARIHGVALRGAAALGVCLRVPRDGAACARQQL